jgi:ABC-type sugar transport system permease subunit
MRSSLLKRAEPYLYVFPAISVLVGFVLLPGALAFIVSFSNWNGISPTIEFVGLSNYVDLLTDDAFGKVVVNTFTYVAMTMPVVLVLGFLSALLVERAGRFTALLRVSFTVPFVVSIAVVSVIWRWILDPNFGILNFVLSSAGIEVQDWLNQPSRAMLVIVVPSIWRQFGYYMLILLAGLKSIDRSVYEAANLDGAGPVRKTVYITFPLLSPQFFFALVLAVLDTFQVFAQVDLMTRGGPLNSTNVAVYYMYQQGFEFFNMGPASAVAFLLMGFLAVVTLAQVKTLGSRVFYQ